MMDRNNEYYDLISGLVKSHRKYAGYEAILEDIIDDVFAHSESVIKTIKDKNVIRAYLEKVVSTSIITVPKKINFHNELKHRTISFEPVPAKETYTAKAPEPAPVINEPEPYIEPVAPVVEQEDLSLNLVEPEVDEPVLSADVPQKVNVEFVDKMINSMDVASVLNQPEEDELSDSDFEEVLEVEDIETSVISEDEPEDAFEVVEDDLDENIVMPSVETTELELTEPDDESEDIVSGYEEPSDDESAPEVIEDYIDKDNELSEPLSENAVVEEDEADEVVTLTTDDEYDEPDVSTAAETELTPGLNNDDTDSMEVVELSMPNNFQPEDTEENIEETFEIQNDEEEADSELTPDDNEGELVSDDEVILGDESEDINPMEEETPVALEQEPQEFEIIEEVESVVDEDDSDELNIAEDVNPIEAETSVTLDEEAPVLLDEESQEFETIEEVEPVVDENVSDELDIAEEEIPSISDESEDINPIEDVSVTLDEEPQELESIDDTESAGIGEFDNSIEINELSSDSDDDLLSANDLIEGDTDFGIGIGGNDDNILSIDNQEQDDLNFANEELMISDTDVTMPDIDSDLSLPAEPDKQSGSSAAKSVDYSAFYFEPKNEEVSYDEQVILQALYILNQQKPEWNVLKIFDLKYKQNLSVNQIAEQLNTDKENIVSVLDEIVNIVS